MKVVTWLGKKANRNCEYDFDDYLIKPRWLMLSCNGYELIDLNCIHDEFVERLEVSIV